MHSYIQWAAAHMQGALLATLILWEWQREGAVSGKLQGGWRQVGFLLNSKENEKRPDKDRHVGRHPGRKGWCRFKLLQDNESEKEGCEVKSLEVHLERLARAHPALRDPGAWLVHKGGQGVVPAVEWQELLFTYRKPQKIVPSPVPSHGYFLFLFFNIAIIIFNWT